MSDVRNPQQFSVDEVSAAGNYMPNLYPKDSRFVRGEYRIPREIDYDYDYFSQEEPHKSLVEGLVQSYASGKHVPPIVVGYDNVVDEGSHRLAAAHKAGLKKIPAYFEQRAQR